MASTRASGIRATAVTQAGSTRSIDGPSSSAVLRARSGRPGSPRPIVADDAPGGLGKQVQPGRVEPAPQGDVRREPPPIVEGGKVVGPDRQEDVLSSPATRSIRRVMVVLDAYLVAGVARSSPGSSSGESATRKPAASSARPWTPRSRLRPR